MNHVLIVDDEQEIRESLEGILREEDYLITTAATAAEAMALLRDAVYDVVLLDVWLPDRDGLDMLVEIKQLEHSPEVIIISGHGTIEAAVKATKLGGLRLSREAVVARSHAAGAEECEPGAADARGQCRVRAAACGEGYGDRAERSDEGAATADQADGSYKWAGADLRRERDG